ncbi:MAG: HAMP domain-containing sensor histidine kinase [Gammaproteobacteria bacterium]|nr:HAMP domain-containing sensor histidine kinase [Gammaproteobacteria bacterium]
MTNYPDQIQSDYLELIANNLAHELKTSLVAVKSGIRGVKDYMPSLVIAYQEAVKHQLDVPDIQARHINMLASALELAERAAHCASAYVSIFSMNMTRVDSEKLILQKCSILECLRLAVDQYPYRSDEQKYFLSNAIKMEHDFLFEGNKELIVNMLVNIFRNAIYNIQDIGKGEILVRTECKAEKNHLYITDTSKSLDLLELEMIFTQFNRLHQHDLGMGLFFCKQLMLALNGDINCRSEEYSFIEFDIMFPINHSNTK